MTYRGAQPLRVKMKDLDKYLKETAPEDRFDMRSHIRDKNGNIVAHNHYSMVMCKKNGKFFERPIGSGQWYTPNGKPCDPPPGYGAKALPHEAKEVKKDGFKTTDKRSSS